MASAITCVTDVPSAYSVQVYFCEEDQVCLYKALAFDVPFSSEEAGDTPQRVTLSALVKPAVRGSGAGSSVHGARYGAEQ